MGNYMCRIKKFFHWIFLTFFRIFGFGKHKKPDIPSKQICETFSVDFISKRLEHLSKKRLFSVRKNGNRAEWKVRPAKFVDAYLFLLNIPHVEISQLQYHRRGDKTVIRTSFHDCKRQLELTSKKTLGENKIFICLTEGKECLLTIHFINDH